jgi:hypothetical protein
MLDNIREEITKCDLKSLTPLDALNFLNDIRERLNKIKK